MVVFTCNHCGDSLQKPKVEKHYAFVCRTVKSLTCVDCFKDFRGEEYAAHTKCLTEDERYAAKGTYANGIVKKGEVKQESWVEMIKSILNEETNMKPSTRNLLSTISSYSNIPRKKNKFLNFINSSSGGRVNMKTVEEVWNIIEQYKNKQVKNKERTNSNKASDKAEQIQTTETSISEAKDTRNENNEIRKRKMVAEESKESEEVPKKKKKHKKNEEISLEQNEQLEEENKKFRFQDAILDILSKKGSISLKKLQKKVINTYLNDTGETEITPKIIKKFNKKLNKLSGLQISDGVVILKTE